MVRLRGRWTYRHKPFTIPTVVEGLQSVANDPLPFSAESWADSKAGLVLQPDTLIGGKYRLLRPAGFGGMGAVWVARNEATNADVAVKVLLADPGEGGGAGGEANLRFRREAHAAAQLYHRGIVRIFDLVELTGSDAGTLVMVMELLRGETLAHAIDQRRSFTLEETLAIILPLLSALAHAHHAGIVHRDLKPENVFLAVDPDGHIIPKILDFGISKMSNPQAPKITTDGAMLGTPSYMSPEQARGSASVDARSDVFAVGILLYEMLAGQSPFASASYHSVIAAILERDPPPLTNVPPSIWRVIKRALDKVAEIRFADAAALGAALKQAAASVGVAAPDASDAFPVRSASIADRSVPPAPYREPQHTAPSIHVSRRQRSRAVGITAAVAVAVILAAISVSRVVRRAPAAEADTAPRAPRLAASQGAAGAAVTASAPSIPAVDRVPVMGIDDLPVASADPHARAAAAPLPAVPASHARGTGSRPRPQAAQGTQVTPPAVVNAPAAAPPPSAPKPASVVRDPGF
jgi:serine/threonine protein kinase